MISFIVMSSHLREWSSIFILIPGSPVYSFITLFIISSYINREYQLKSHNYQQYNYRLEYTLYLLLLDTPESSGISSIILLGTSHVIFSIWKQILLIGMVIIFILTSKIYIYTLKITWILYRSVRWGYYYD